MAFTIRMVANDDASAKIRRVSGAMDGASKSASRLSRDFKALVGAYAGIQGFRALVGGMRSVTGAFLVQESAEKRLAAAMRERNVFTAESFEYQKKYAASLQTMSSYGDEEILVVQRLLTQYGLYGGAVDQATKATLELATAKGMDLKAAADLLGKSVTSSTNAMSRYGISIEGAVGTTERLDTALAGINEKFGGSAAADVETYAGQLKQMTMMWGDLQEAIGGKVVPAINAATEAFMAFFNIGTQNQLRTLEIEMINLQLRINDINTAKMGGGGFWGWLTRTRTDQDINQSVHLLNEELKQLSAQKEKLEKGVEARTGGGILAGGGGAGGAGKGYSLADDPTYNKEAGQLAKDIAAGEKVRHDNWLKMQEEKEEKYEAAIQHQKDFAALIKKLDEEEIARKEKKKIADEQLAASTIGNALEMANMFKNNSKEAFNLSKALAIVQATNNARVAYTGALGSPPYGFWNIAAAMAVLGLGMAQVGAITSSTYQGKRRGGVVDGPGTGTSDSVPIMASKGEGLLTRDEMAMGRGMNNIRAMLRNQGGGVTINVGGNIIGEDRWIRSNLLPAIQREVSRG